MEKQIEKKSTNNHVHFLGAVNALLDNLNEKDESLRISIENSLNRMCEKRPNITIDSLYDYRMKHTKLGETQIAIILRIIENYTLSHTKQLNDEILQKAIDLSISEMIKSYDNYPILQKPCQEILVSIGRIHCDKVMDNLTKQLQKVNTTHFMVLYCMGSLATANIAGIKPYIKPTLETILPTLSMIKLDHVKQAYAFAIGRFSEAITEHLINLSDEQRIDIMNKEIINENDNQQQTESYGTEISIAYGIFLHQWLPNREPKVSSDILQSLSYMYPLLPNEKSIDQISKIIPLLLNFYRRSMDRNAITQLLCSILRTAMSKCSETLDPLSDTLITTLFDLVCVNPDYEKPQTVKGHYEVLRCFDLLFEKYSRKILDVLLIQLRNNNERERIKSLLVLTHLTITADKFIEQKLPEILEILKSMLVTEKIIKIKMVLLKTIVVFSQKNFIHDKHFIRFILRNCLKNSKPYYNNDNGTTDEYNDFIDTCKNTIFSLSSTVEPMRNLLKCELLYCFMLYDHTDICSTIAKCLAKLFEKITTDNNLININDEDNNNNNNNDEDNSGETKATAVTTTPIKSPRTDSMEHIDKDTIIPSPESIFIRCLILMGNLNETKRTINILNFLKQYSHVFNNTAINTLWGERIPKLLSLIINDGFLIEIYKFLKFTLKEINDIKVVESMVNKIADQIILYPNFNIMSTHSLPIVYDTFVPELKIERGMLLKLLGIALCYVTDVPSIEIKIDLIIYTARNEKLDKNSPLTEYETRLRDASEALGFLAEQHWPILMKKLNVLIEYVNNRKQSGNLFTALNFMKDSNKETDYYKTNLLLIQSYEYIIQNISVDNQLLNDINEQIITFLFKQLSETKDFSMRRIILQTLLTILQEIYKITKDVDFQIKLYSDILIQLLKIEAILENLPLYPIILKIATILIKISNNNPNAKNMDGNNDNDNIDINDFFDEICRKLFTFAQQLKSHFNSMEEDEKNSYLAKYINQSLPELNFFIKALFERNSSPATLDDIICSLECWIKDRNCEVRICAGHVMNSSLEFYIKTMKIGCEAPSKFNQTGSMLGKIVPRCIDSNATIRQTSIDILRKTLEISCIYETLTIADNNVEWVNDLEKIRNDIVTDDRKEMYRIANEIAKVISIRLSNFQYLQFSKSLLHTLNDPEESSAIGASVVLKCFIQFKGSELFHAISEYVKEALYTLTICTYPRTKSGVLKSLVALTKYHPKLVCNDILNYNLPFENNVIEFWQTLSNDAELTGIILDNFLTTLASSCLYDSDHYSGNDHQNIANIQPFAIICALHEIFPSTEIQNELRQRFAEIFCMLLTTLATYTNLAPPAIAKSSASASAVNTITTSGKTKYSFIPNKDAIKLNPCQIVLETLQIFLDNLGFYQISAVLDVCPNLSTSTELNNYMNILTPMAVGLVNQFGITSTTMKEIITILSKYISSPYDSQRLTAIGLYSQLIPLHPIGEIASVIMLHLNAALNDPNPLVRGFGIRGLAYVGNLAEHDIEKYTEMSLTALLKGIDDSNNDCLINIPLESMRGLSRILKELPGEKLEIFQISLAIRIRPFFENPSLEIREAAILLFGDLCQIRKQSRTLPRSDEILFVDVDDDDNNSVNYIDVSDALREQLFTNFIPLLLHLSETESKIITASKITLRKICGLINAPKVNAMVQAHLLKHGQLHYDIFLIDFIKILAEELNDYLCDFIESAVTFLKSMWPELRGNAALIIGYLHNLNTSKQANTENVANKISVLLKDEQIAVRIKAVKSLGFMFGDIL